MESIEFNNYTERLRASLEAISGVVGLVTLGSTADASLRDEWSDHDFWVITEPGAQDSLIADLSWLPDHQDIAMTISHGAHRRTMLFHNRHKVEFAVFDADEARSSGRVERYSVLIDRDEVSQLILTIHDDSLQQAEIRLEALVNLCGMVWSACERYWRGEVLSARQYVDGFAINLLLNLLRVNEPNAADNDALDPRRRLEQRSPALAAKLLAIQNEPVPEAALHILEIVERELKPKAPALAWDKVALVRSWINSR
jgi:hypothetical protein